MAEGKENFDETIVQQTAQFSRCSITSMSAFFGGIVAQEIVKHTGKYMPLQ